MPENSKKTLDRAAKSAYHQIEQLKNCSIDGDFHGRR